MLEQTTGDGSTLQPEEPEFKGALPEVAGKDDKNINGVQVAHFGSSFSYKITGDATDSANATTSAPPVEGLLTATGKDTNIQEVNK